MRVLVRVLPDAGSGTAQLEIIQSRLLDVGSAVATPMESCGPGADTKQQRVQFDSGATSALEAWIDQMDQELPQLTNFILPSGTMFICSRWPTSLQAMPLSFPMLGRQPISSLAAIMQAVMRRHLCTWPAQYVDEQSEQSCRLRNMDL